MKKILLTAFLLLISLPTTALAADTIIRISSSDIISHDIAIVEEGDIITWVNDDSELHEIDGDVVFNLDEGDRHSERFSSEGLFRYTIDGGDTQYEIEVRAQEIQESTAPSDQASDNTDSTDVSGTTTGAGSTGPLPKTCPANSTGSYPQCLFGITGNEQLVQTDATYLPQVYSKEITGRDLVKLIVRFILGFVGAVALLILVIGGFMYIMARGEEGQVDKAKNTVYGAVIGIIIVLAAWTIVTTVLNLTERRGGNQFLPGNSQQNNP